jgi:membrane associated rhomboid family serine protease
MTAGVLYGLLIGLVFALFPVLLATAAFRRGRRYKLRVAIFGGALLLALPNWVTLSIALGAGSGAHAGDRILDIEGPGFRVGSAWGAAIGVLVGLAMVALLWKWRRDRAQLRAFRRERNAAESAGPE